MKKILTLFLLVFTLFIFSKNAEAKVLPQAHKGKPVVTPTTSTSGIGIYPYLRADRRALIINFSNLQNATSVSYLLTYKTSTQEEGAQGTLILNGSSSQSVELLFGTCSKGVCRYHVGIKDAKLEVTYTLKSGKKYIKRFKIKI